MRPANSSFDLEFDHAARAAVAAGAGAPGDGAGALHRAFLLVAVARAGTVGLAATLDAAWRESSPLRGAALAVAVLHAVARLRWSRPGPGAAWVDATLAAGVVAVTGGLGSNYVPFALVTALGGGLAAGSVVGALAGIGIALGSARLVLGELAVGATDGREVTTWFALFASVGVVGGLAARAWRAEPATARVLSEANRVLSTLSRIARAMPGGLETGSVVASVLDRVESATGASAAAVLLRDGDALSIAGSYGIDSPDQVRMGAESPLLRIRGARTIPRGALGPGSTALGTKAEWLVAPMRHGGECGLLLAACEVGAQSRGGARALASLAEEASIALDNARLFGGVREMTVDEERHRIARELHDGVAQALAHLRLELEFMSGRRDGDAEAVRGEVARLARVAERALTDVRWTVLGLRSSPSPEGLVASLRAYVGELDGLGTPSLTFEADGEVRLAPAAEAEVFRIAQEAVSNALRHARAANLRVRVLGGDDLVLEVEDDGVGIEAAGPPAPGGGLGLTAMRERARRIGAEVRVDPGASAGTRVTLVCPSVRRRIA